MPIIIARYIDIFTTTGNRFISFTFCKTDKRDIQYYRFS